MYSIAFLKIADLFNWNNRKVTFMKPSVGKYSSDSEGQLILENVTMKIKDTPTCL